MAHSFLYSCSAAVLSGLLLASASVTVKASPPGHGDHGHGHGEKKPLPKGVSALDVYAVGDSLHVLTAEYDGQHAEPKLIYIGSSDAGKSWSEPVQVDAGQKHAHAAMRGMDPQVAAVGDKLIAVWMTPGTDRFGGGPMATAISNDGGRTWKAGPNPADDGSTEGHGFLDIAADNKGGFHVVWLDTREEARGLRYSQSKDGGATWSANQTLDKETCECCWNNIVTTEQGAVAVLFRDKNPRDMRVTLSQDGGQSWQPVQTVGEFAWQFDGCPHVGGSLVQNGSTWHAAVWTGNAGKTGVYYSHSADEGKSWKSTGSPFAVDGTHPSLAIDQKGRLLLAWTLLTENGPVIQTTLSTDGGKTWSDAAQQSLTGVSASHPLVVTTAEGFRVFWTEKGAHQPGVWRMLMVP